MSQDSLFEKQYSLDDLTKKVDELKQKIVAADYRYYVLAEPSISDREYDSVFKELQDIELAYPELQTQDSPTKRVGGQPLKEFKQFKHIIPMLSLSNTYTNQELSDFDRKVENQRIMMRDGDGFQVQRRASTLTATAISLLASNNTLR